MESRFIYRANALAVGGFFTRPVQQVIDVPAASTLPSAGGYMTAKAGPYRIEKFLTFESAYTQVSGTRDPKDGSYTTLAAATIERLNVLDVLTVDRVVAQLATKLDPAKGEIEIVPLGTRFDNLRIGGRDACVELDVELFTELSTYSALERHWRENRDFRYKARERYGWHAEANLDDEGIGLPESGGMVCCSLLRGCKADDGIIAASGYEIRIPQFGRITLGELHVSRKRRRLTMLRIDLGSPVEGTVTAGEVEGNGSLFP